MTKEHTTESMLISVGGSPDVIVKSIELNKPDKIVFFVSRGSYDSVTQDILPNVMKVCGRIPPHELVVTPDEQDVGESTFALLKDVPIALRKLGLESNWTTTCDLTGGTKPMSAALVWASSRFPCTFSYIGSDSPESRTKGGLGIVVGGKEKSLLHENPWNAIAYYEVQQAVVLFNSGQYANAVTALDAILERISDPQRSRLLKLIRGVFKGYDFWDKFNHRKAIKEFKDHLQQLFDLAQKEESSFPGLTLFADTSLECLETLNSLSTSRPDELSHAKIYDLLANALRRAKLEEKYDDATARCYSAIEKYGKYQLKWKHGINNSNCRPEQLPESLHKEYVQRYSKDNDNLAFGLQATFELLGHLGDNVGQRFLFIKPELDKVLPLRNASILGHGCVPIKKESFERIFKLALDLMNLPESDLTVFPSIEPS